MRRLAFCQKSIFSRSSLLRQSGRTARPITDCNSLHQEAIKCWISKTQDISPDTVQCAIRQDRCLQALFASSEESSNVSRNLARFVQIQSDNRLRLNILVSVLTRVVVIIFFSDKFNVAALLLIVWYKEELSQKHKLKVPCVSSRDKANTPDGSTGTDSSIGLMLTVDCLRLRLANAKYLLRLPVYNLKQHLPAACF